MEKTLLEIKENKNDYKTCKACDYINYYANTNCIHCNEDKFNDIGFEIKESVDELHTLFTDTYNNTNPFSKKYIEVDGYPTLNEVTIKV